MGNAHKSKKFDKIDLQNKSLGIRIALTTIFVVAFLLTFFLCGGMMLLQCRLGEQKCFIKEDFEVHFIDVGQGDSAYIKFSDNSTMLIDAGPKSSAQSLCDYLCDVFRQEGIKQIDHFVITHQDSDHVGGGKMIFDKFVIKNFYRPMVYSTFELENFDCDLGYATSQTQAYNNVITAAYQEEDCRMFYNFQGIVLGDESYTVRFLLPTQTYYKGTSEESQSNAYSPIIRIDYGGKSFLFTGDAGFDSENEVIAASSQYLDCDVLKVAHHGSKNGTSEKFLQYVTPSIAVISVGTNSYGHPNTETLARLQKWDCQILTTKTGSLAFTVKDGNIILGGYTNTVSPILTILVSVQILAIGLIWGIKLPQKGKNGAKKTQNMK